MANPANFLLRARRPVSAILGIASGLVLNSSRAATWSEIDSALPSTGVSVRAVAIASKTPATIYATAAGADGSSYIFKTTDGAATWKPISSTVLGNSVLVDPQNSSIVYALTGRGILKSTNGGDTWARAAAGLPDIFVSMMAIDPVTTSNLYAVAGNAIFKSTNGGESWSALNTGFPPNTFFISVFVDPATPSNVYATGFAPQNSCHGHLYCRLTFRRTGSRRCAWPSSGWCEIPPIWPKWTRFNTRSASCRARKWRAI